MSLQPIYTFKVSGGIFEIYHSRPSFPFEEVRQTHSTIVSLSPCG